VADLLEQSYRETVPQQASSCKHEGVIATLLEREKSSKEAITEVKEEYRYFRQTMEKQSELLQSMVNNMTELKVTNLNIQQMATDLRRVDTNVSCLGKELQKTKATLSALDKQVMENVFIFDRESRERDLRLEQLISDAVAAPGKDTLAHWSKTKISLIASLLASMTTLIVSKMLTLVGRV